MSRLAAALFLKAFFGSGRVASTLQQPSNWIHKPSSKIYQLFFPQMMLPTTRPSKMLEVGGSALMILLA